MFKRKKLYAESLAPRLGVEAYCSSARLHVHISVKSSPSTLTFTGAKTIDLCLCSPPSVKPSYIPVLGWTIIEMEKYFPISIRENKNGDFLERYKIFYRGYYRARY